MAALVLGGCSTQSKEQSHASSDNKSSSVNTTSNKQSVTTTKWNQSKDGKLATYIKKWGPTLDQSYTQYQPGHNVDFYGLNYPSDLANYKFNLDGTMATAKQSNNGDGNSDYNVVAIYSDIDSIGSKPGAYIYFFAFHNGQPVALVSDQTNGNVQTDGLAVRETENPDIKQAFVDIVNGNQTTAPKASSATQASSTDSSTSSSESESTNLMTQEPDGLPDNAKIHNLKEAEAAVVAKYGKSDDDGPYVFEEDFMAYTTDPDTNQPAFLVRGKHKSTIAEESSLRESDSDMQFSSFNNLDFYVYPDGKIDDPY